MSENEGWIDDKANELVDNVKQEIKKYRQQLKLQCLSVAIVTHKDQTSGNIVLAAKEYYNFVRT